MPTQPHPSSPGGGNSYWEMEVELPPEAEELWSLFCYDRGASGAEQVDSRDSALRMRYFFSSLAPGAQTGRYWSDAFRAQYPGASLPGRIALNRRQARDWQMAWREHFTPAPVGARLMVRPPWDTHGAARAGKDDSRQALIIDPGQGFGTGGHASTILALELIEAALSPPAARPTPAAMLDVGIGSGILAIGAALLGVRELWGLDIDPRTFPEVRRNFELNGLARAPRLVRGQPDCLKGAFPLVAANLTAPILRDFVKELVQLTTPGGNLVLSGMLDSEGPGVEAEFIDAGCAAVQSVQKEGWHASRLLRNA